MLDNVPKAEPRAFRTPAASSYQVFTDGSFEQGAGRLGGVLRSPTGQITDWFQATVPSDIVQSWLQSDTLHPILQCELLAVSVAAALWGSLLKDWPVIWWIDNDAARHCLISARGYPDSNFRLVQTSDPAVMCGIRHRRSHHHPLPLRRFRPFPVRRRFAARMPQHHLSRHGQLVSNMCLRWSRRLQRRPGGLYLVFHQCAWCRRVPLRLQRHRAQVEGAELPAHKTYQRQAAPPRVLIPKARPSRGHLSGHLRVPSPTVWSQTRERSRSRDREQEDALSDVS